MDGAPPPPQRKHERYLSSERRDARPRRGYESATSQSDRIDAPHFPKAKWAASEVRSRVADWTATLGGGRPQ